MCVDPDDFYTGFYFQIMMYWSHMLSIFRKKTIFKDPQKLALLDECAFLIYRQSIKQSDNLLLFMLETIKDQKPHSSIESINFGRIFTYLWCFRLYTFQLLLRRLALSNINSTVDEFNNRVMDIVYVKSKEHMVKKLNQLKNKTDTSDLDSFVDVMLGMFYELEFCSLDNPRFIEKGESVVNFVFMEIFKEYGYDCSKIDIFSSVYLKKFILQHNDNENEILFIPWLNKIAA